MAGDPTVDPTDWRLPEALQADGRSAYPARVVAMSPSAVAERVRRLEEDRRPPMAD
jgi:Lrp/AsnC family leucine-responsive transcriptional regulator